MAHGLVNPETSPTLTSTSHTLSGQQLSMAPSLSTPLTSSDDAMALSQFLNPENRHSFLQPSSSIPTSSLHLVQRTLEALASQVEEEQQRKIAESRKRKRKSNLDAIEPLKVRKVYVDGFETTQVWEQAKRIIHGVLLHSETAIERAEQLQAAVVGSSDDEALDSDAYNETFKSLDGDGEEASEDELDENEEDEQEYEEDDDEEEGEEDDDIEEYGTAEELSNLEGAEDDGDVNSQDDEDDLGNGEYVEDPHGLNDGFFSIDDFNKQTQWFEEQDARGNPNTDLGSDDEDIDWTADPRKAKPATSAKPGEKQGRKSQQEADEDASDSDDEKDGPTFGNMDLDAPEGFSDEEDLDDGAGSENESDTNANDLFYKDFFGPPPKKSTSKGQKRARPVPSHEEVERAMTDVKRDLFDSEDSDMDDSDGDALSDVSAGDPKSRRSTHERKQAKLADEIRKLEAASIAKREWTLSGEATAVERPQNSLLEQDLDFEHGGKPVPVITPEVTEDIEALIKRRILAQEFDEVLRRRPDADAPADTRRGLQAVDDTKNDKGLADIYEEEHTKNNNPDSYVSASDEKLAKEEAEVANMWKDLSAKLDALSSWHYKPKPSAPALSVVADVASVAMEDAQPATAQGMSTSSSRLAPQEIYAADRTNAQRGELVTKGGAPLAREELSREEKASRRRREKERVKKAGGRSALEGKRPLSGKAKSQADTMAELKRGGVRVINRKGELTDIEGKKAKPVEAISSGKFKL